MLKYVIGLSFASFEAHLHVLHLLDAFLSLLLPRYANSFVDLSEVL